MKNIIKNLLFLGLGFFLVQYSYPQEIDSMKTTPVAIHGQLSIENGNIIDSKGEPVQLKGMSLFWSQWQPQFYNAESVINLKKYWNVDVVRAAMAVEHEGYLKYPQREKEKVQRVIEAAIDAGIYVIIDWHDHHAEDHLEEAISFFSEMAQRYGEYPNVIYETYNEPLDVSWSQVLKPYHEEVIGAIREYDQDNIIVVGTPRWSQRVDLAAEDPIDAENIAYTLHFYAGTHGQKLRDIAQEAIDKGLALFITEYGTTQATGDGKVDKKETRKWWRFMDANNLSWANWSIASKDEASAAVIPGTTPSELKDDDFLTISGKLVKSQLLKD